MVAVQMNLIELHERYLKSKLTLRRIAATPPRAVKFLVGPLNLPVAGRLPQNHQKPPFFLRGGMFLFIPQIISCMNQHIILDHFSRV